MGALEALEQPFYIKPNREIRDLAELIAMGLRTQTPQAVQFIGFGLRELELHDILSQIDLKNGDLAEYDHE